MRCISPTKIKVGYDYSAATVVSKSKGVAVVPCGNCINCRIDQSRVWRTRLQLENCMNTDSVFVSLTYADRFLPDPPHVKKKDLQSYIRKVKYNVDPIKIRYYGVGEYGDQSFRPHYHIIFFGLSMLNEKTLYNCWRKCEKDVGFHVGEVNEESISYITGYISKKVLKQKGVHPVSYGKKDEFMLCSRHPRGIGVYAAQKMIDKIKKDKRIGKNYYTSVRVGGKILPLGRLLKGVMNNDITYQEKLIRFWQSQMGYLEKRGKVELAKYDKRVTI